MPPLSDDEFRTRLRALLARSGRSMRGLSAAMGRDPGYIASLLDPARRPRARPTPADLVAVADATGIPLVEWLAELWGIDRSRLAAELTRAGLAGSTDPRLASLTSAERSLVDELIDTLAVKGADRPARRSRAR